MTDVLPRSTAWTFEDFQPGTELGSVEILIDPTRIVLWEKVFGPLGDNRAVPSGMLVAAMMEAYIKAIQPRPPGNVHTAQSLSFSGTSVLPGAALNFTFSCLHKELRKERRWVTFGISTRANEKLAMQGKISTIWAA